MPPKDEMEDMKITFEGGSTFKMGNDDSWVPGDGLQYGGGTVDSVDIQGTYDIGQMSFDYEGDLRKKYPALKQAYEHYQNIKQMCETREKEEDAN